LFDFLALAGIKPIAHAMEEEMARDLFDRRPVAVMGLSVDADDEELLRYVFRSMDTDNNGNISRDELQAALSSENKELAEALKVAIKEEDRAAGINYAAFKKGADQVCPPCSCSSNSSPHTSWQIYVWRASWDSNHISVDEFELGIQIVCLFTS
jgi:hypothetical protein